MQRQFNFKFLALVLVILIVGAGLLYFLHSRQRDRIADALLQQAETSMQEKDSTKACKFFERYVSMRPNDTATLSRYAALLFETAKDNDAKVRALLVLDKAVIKDPDNFDLRRKLVELAIVPGFDEVTRPEPHLLRLLERKPNDTQLISMLAFRLYNEGKYADAVTEIDKLLALAPQRIDAFVLKARIQRINLNAIKQAEQTIQQMVQANNTADAHLSASEYWRQYGIAAQVDKEVKAAAALDPNNLRVLIAQAELAMGRNQLDEARKYLKKCREVHPKEVIALQALAALELEANRPAEAIAALKTALEIKSDREDLFFALAEAYLRAEKFSEAEALIQTLRSKEYRPVMIQLLEAQVLASKGEWVKATRLFEDALTQVTDSGPLVKQCNLVLARCYEAIGDLDNRIAAYRRVVAEEPMNELASLQLARALAEQGRTDEALALLQGRSIRLADSAMFLCDLLQQKQLLLPAVQRNWSAFDAALVAVEEAIAGSPQAATPMLAVIKAKRQWATDQGQQALQTLDVAQKRWPQSLELWVARAEFYLNRQQFDLFKKTLTDARQAVGDQPKLRYLEAQQMLQQSKLDPKQLDRFTDNLASFKPAQQVELLRLILDLRIRVGDIPGAVKLADQIDALLPGDLTHQLLRFDLAARVDDEARMKQIIEKIKTVEGTAGIYNPLAQALVIMWKAGKLKDKKNLDQAAVYLAVVAKKRPDWPRLQLAEGKLRELQGDTLNTLASYQQAVSRGSRDPEALAWLVQTHYRQQRYREANEMIRLLPEAMVTGELTKIAAELSIANKDFKTALSWAMKAVPDDSKNADDLLWKGQIFSATGEQQQAEKYLQQAIAVKQGKDGRAWLALVQHYIHHKAGAAASKAVSQAHQQLPPQTTWYPLCLEAIGQFDEAAKEFGTLVSAKPQDLETLRAAADYFVRRNDGKNAEPLLARILELQDKSTTDKAWARRTLAIILASRGEYHQSRKALALLGLLDSNNKIITKIGDNEAVDDLRARAMVFGLNRSRALRQEATQVFEQLAIRQARTNDDLYFQAKLHNDLGDWGKCRECMQTLLTRDPNNVDYHEFMIRNLLLHADYSPARLYLDQLEKLLTGSDLVIDLQARLLAATGSREKALALIEDHFLKGKPPRPEKAAELLEDMKLIEPAEGIYRRLAKEIAKPEASLNLARFLGRQKKLKEALALCLAARNSAASPEEVAFITIEALYNAPQRTKEEMAEVASWLDTLVQQKPTAPRFKLLAAIRNLQGRYEESIKLYEKVVGMDKNDVGSRNNLAFLLAMQQKQYSEALQHLNDSLQVIGPHPDLLDTKALVYLQMGKSDQAMDELMQAMDQDPSAMAQFHLACVHKVKRNRQYALSAWEEMKRRKLSRDDVHPLEWPAYDALVQDYDGGILPPPTKTVQ